MRKQDVGAQKGELKLYDLTHEIPAYNIWEAAYRLQQAMEFWPEGTVFVSVVDPGVGTDRKSVVAKTKSGHFVVTPDNGTLTLVSETLGIDSVRQIDEEKNRRQNSSASYTFHGRDVYAYTAARLASGKISFHQVGDALNKDIVRIPYKHASIENNKLTGNIPVLDVQYGNVWTNIPADFLKKLNLKTGEMLKVSVFRNKKPTYTGIMPFHETFGSVAEGKPLAYLNSLMQLSFALNMGNFAKKYGISSGNDWSVEVSTVR